MPFNFTLDGWDCNGVICKNYGKKANTDVKSIVFGVVDAKINISESISLYSQSSITMGMKYKVMGIG